MSANIDAIRQAIAGANVKILADVAAAFKGIEVWEGERLTEYASVYYGIERVAGETDETARPLSRQAKRVLP